MQEAIIESVRNPGFKPLLAESSESIRLKAKLSGLWNRDIPLPEFDQNKISLAESAGDADLKH